jgi:D-sedoheptulose 7-phosphate isomerase
VNRTEFIGAELAEHGTVFEATLSACAEPLGLLIEACVASVRAGGKLLFFGNGGSAADAQHLATELTVRYLKDRAPIAALALTADSATLTAIGNDFGFEHLFARQIEALGRPGDIAIGISTSGNSATVIAGLRQARVMGIGAAAFGGGTGGALRDFAGPMVIVPSRTVARIQEMHIVLGHILCGAIERELGLGAGRV